jgi:hypothetical protein
MKVLSKKDKQGIGLIAAVVIIVGLLIAYNLSLSSRQRPDALNCIAPVTKKTVFVIDQSDSIPEQTAAEILRRIRNAVASDVSDNEQVTIFQVTDGSRTHLEPIFSKCKPAKDGFELTENVRMIRKRFADEFAKPLEAALATATPKSSTSPIGEVLIDLSLSDYLRGDTNRLFVFSDLMQNSGNTSLYRCSDSKHAVSEFRARRSGAVERPTFRNTAISLNFIPREGIGAPTVRCRAGFWSWFFGDNEGANASLTPDYLPGGAKL